LYYPAIAQLAERPTVEVLWLSGGPWFESGWPDVFFRQFSVKSEIKKVKLNFIIDIQMLAI
jgi:hypothetical protein